MCDGGVDRDDQIKAADQSGSIGKIMDLVGMVDQREGGSRGFVTDLKAKEGYARQVGQGG
jgi:hypothetical protein